MGRSPGLAMQPSSEMTQQCIHSGTTTPGKAQTGSQAWSQTLLSAQLPLPFPTLNIPLSSHRDSCWG